MKSPSVLLTHGEFLAGETQSMKPIFRRQIGCLPVPAGIKFCLVERSLRTRSRFVLKCLLDPLVVLSLSLCLLVLLVFSSLFFSFSFLFFSYLFLFVLSVQCCLFCIGGMCMFIIIPLL